MSYANMEIADGETASTGFLSLYDLKDENAIATIRKNLFEYCKLDTYAMVCLLEKLEDVV